MRAAMFDRARFRFTYALVATILTRPSLGVAALYWSLTGRRQRARNRLRVGIEQGPHAYRLWIDALERQIGRAHV